MHKKPDESRSFVMPVNIPGIKSEKIFIKRDDLIHPAMSGNKWRKLKYNLLEAKNLGFDTLLTFGGAFSNHIYAVASAGKIFGFKTIGIIRGEERFPLNHTLLFASKNGMELHYLNRTEYRRRNEKEFQEAIADKFGNPFLIPEGGTNELALKGVSEIFNELENDYNFVCTAVGSAGTVSGLISSAPQNTTVLGFPALKNGEYLSEIVAELIGEEKSQRKNWELFYEYHFGGFAKINRELVDFMNEFEKINDFEIDPIYTTKMIYGVRDLIQKGKIAKGGSVLLLHTGGIQGKEGMKEKINKLLSSPIKTKN
ncbi:MAG: pyridoxal-phosphate dependent enzyme [Melioribacteraceae bacterium]|nr:pyridoxal-phosphate dependent enzyme [Melioribacteraceae bacterium]MCF8263036.1 pyridoxal-phosphate dependent enzyme [Melioribacteraceae bacterium]MCF8414120.1 pyridoxal-phosphate dependent enzyme [Melioribacteraceae bacterium]MCF8430481.1 pyridoxal-phosphate dependent enzyme [Melioribacteraceae bacterium]